jgi:hypothetical protein
MSFARGRAGGRTSGPFTSEERTELVFVCALSAETAGLIMIREYDTLTAVLFHITYVVMLCSA